MAGSSGDVIACSLAPDATNNLRELSAQMRGEAPSPTDEGHPEGGPPIQIPNGNSTRNGGGAVRVTPWGELTVSPGNATIGEEGQGGPAALALAADWGASASKCWNPR